MNKKYKLMTGSEAIRDALICAQKKINNILLISEGIADPSSFYGTTKDLADYFKKNQIIEMPLSESALAGISIGAAINGMRPVLNFHRVEFALLSMEQIFNNAAKASYISNGKHKVPFVLRLVVGRGWGQGPAHSQSLENIFSSIPGLKVIMPAMPNDTKGLIIGAIKDNNPVIIIEHRWCHYVSEKVQKGFFINNLNEGPKKLSNGDDFVIVASSYGVIESLQVINIMKKYGIKITLFDLRILRPLNLNSIIASVKKSGRLMTIDTGFKFLGIGSEITSQIVERCFQNLKSPPIRLGFPDHPTPSSRGYLKDVYIDANIISEQIMKKLKINLNIKKKIRNEIKKISNKKIDIPNPLFKGPF